ncbi:MAG TPA: dihydrofolate reductase [Candidatus Peribacteraceae bacterium]|nr:dihydrofolate reductase [Candidatus Peribacteraceae bacterium]
MLLSLIAAVSENNVIGKGGTLPWHLPADLAHFRALTTGKPVIMGRKTFASIGRPLPNRQNIILTRDETFQAEGCDIAHTLDDAIAMAEDGGAGEAMVIGGEQIYQSAMSLATHMYLTLVHTYVEDGDAFFPEIDYRQWQETERVEHPADEENPIPFSMATYERIRLP